MSIEREPSTTKQTNVTGTGAVTIIPASGESSIFCDLVSLIVTTVNAAAATLTVSDGTKIVAVLNYPNAAAAPTTPLILQFCDVPLAQSVSNAAWTITASVNGTSFNVTAQYLTR